MSAFSDAIPDVNAERKMSAGLDVFIEGIGVWSPGLPDWQTLRGIFDGSQTSTVEAAIRPAARMMAATERRRAPESVLLAVDVAGQACAMAAREPRELPSVFASAYGDLTINDYLCAVLARAAQELSPTRFHNSVHNAPSGNWTIATGCMQTSSALSAGDASFGAGLLEAAMLMKAEASPVLFVASDIGASGPLCDVIPARGAFGVAFVLGLDASRALARLRLSLQSMSAIAVFDAGTLASEPALLHAVDHRNPAAQALPLLAALARRETRVLCVGAAPELFLRMEISPWPI